MKCPNCQAELSEFYFGNLKLNKCPECAGIWFDKNELSRAIDKRDKDLAWMHFDLWRERKKFGAEKGERLCPHCGRGMAKLVYDGSAVEVDICGDCGGVWLDKGEMEKIVDFLEKSLDKKSAPDYIREIAAESGRAISDPKHGAEEAYHIMILAKLLEYRVLAEHPFITGLISLLPS